MDTTLVNIPFEGFYCSKFSDMLDSDLRHEAEYKTSDECEEDRRIDIEEPEYACILFDCMDWTGAYNAIANKYVYAFNALFKDETGVDLCLAFSDLESPKYYNFSTDRIFAHAAESAIAQLFSMVDHAVLSRIIKERFTSCSGFISHYSNHLSDWLEKPINEWDINETCTLIMCFLPDDYDWTIFYGLSEQSYEIFDAFVDWNKVYEKVYEKVNELKGAE